MSPSFSMLSFGSGEGVTWQCPARGSKRFITPLMLPVNCSIEN